MNGPQKKALVIGLLVAGLVGLFPPWERRGVLDYGPFVVQAGHAPLFLPPKPYLAGGIRLVTYNVAYLRLLVYWAIISLATIGALVLLGRTSKRGG